MAHKTAYENVFRTKVALEAARVDKTIEDIATEYNVAANLFNK